MQNISYSLIIEVQKWVYYLFLGFKKVVVFTIYKEGFSLV